MSPVIRHLHDSFLEFPLADDRSSSEWTFSERIKNLGPDFYSKVMSNHRLLNLEYNVLCQQLRTNLFATQDNKDQIINQLISALMLAELLEHLHLYYLNVPREVQRFRQHRTVYMELLASCGVYSFPSNLPEANAIQVGLSLAQRIRETTVDKNWYRLLIVRMKRLLDLINLVGTNSEGFRKLVVHMDKYMNPVLPYLAWCFLLPRLITNLVLTLKHTIPGRWMSEEEKSIGWKMRLQTQIQRRWFELGNDIVWVAIGLINCFILTGVLAPAGMYLTVAFFGYDLLLAGLRAYIELKRLFGLQKQYTALILGEGNEENKKELMAFQDQLTHRIHFEKLRLGINVTVAAALFIAMCFAIPAFVLNPIIPLIGAIWLVAVSLVSFILTKVLEQHRPKDTIEKPSGVVGLGFFSKAKTESSPKLIPTEDQIATELVATNNL